MKFDKNCNLNIYFGLPGSGKSTTAASIVRSGIRKKIRVFSNVPIVGAYHFSIDDIGTYDLSHSIIIIDEAGLEVGNREWKTNFKNPNSLRWWKTFRHEKCQIHVFSQSWNDCDVKIRALATKLWYVRRSLIPFFVLAIPITKKFEINETTKEPCDSYHLPHPFIVPFVSKWTFMPSTWKFFNSWESPGYAVKQFDLW